MFEDPKSESPSYQKVIDFWLALHLITFIWESHFFR